MSFYSLLHNIAHRYPGKIPGLALDMNKKSSQALTNKLNPNTNDAHINPHEVEEMLDLAKDGNAEVARFFADKAGMLLIPMITMDGSDLELLDGYLDLVKQHGEFANELQAAYSDGRIDAKEWERIHKEGTDVMGRMAALMDRVKQMVDQKPSQQGRE